MDSLKIIKWINWLAVVLVVGTPLFYLRQSVYPYTFSKAFFSQAVIEIIFFLWLVIAVLDKKYWPRFRGLNLAVLIFLGVLFLTALLGEDFGRSFWSTQERNLGVFAFMHLAALFLVLSSLRSEIQWKRIFYWSFGVSLVVVIVQFIQLKNPNILLREPAGRPGSFFGNPTFAAGYLVFNFFLALYYLLESKAGGFLNKFRYEKLEGLFLALVMVASVAGIFITQTRGDILGLVAGIFVLMILFAFRPAEEVRVLNNPKLLKLLVLGLVLLGAFFWFTRTNDFWASVPGLSRFKDISLESESLQPRLIAINAAWQGFLEKPIFGWGFENFNLAFNKYYDPAALTVSYQETRFDKPHNLFLEILVSGGVLLASAFIYLFIILFKGLLRRSDFIWGNLAIAVIAAYLVRSFFVFDTIGPAMMFYLVLAYSSFKLEKGNEAIDSRAGQGTIFTSKPLLAGGLAAALVLVYFLNFRPVLASYYQFHGFINFVKGDSREAINNFEEALDMAGFYSYYFTRDYAGAISEAYFFRPETVSKDEVIRVIGLMEEVTREHPKDAYNHYALVDMYNQVSDINPEKLLTLAEKEAQIALGLSPNRQQVMFSLAKTKHLQGKKEEALALAKKALDLNRDAVDSHFYYGLLAYDSNMPEEGYKSLKKVIDSGRRWKTYQELLVVGNFLADSGHLEEALELYKKAQGMDPENLEVRAKLGAAYFFLGDKESARRELGYVVERFDIRNSSAFSFYYPILKDLGLVD